MTPELFDRMVSQAIEDVPAFLSRYIENVEIIVEDFAGGSTLASVGLESPWELLGLYVGVPRNQRSVFLSVPLPDRIYLYRHPIVSAAGESGEIKKTIREVLIHEIGHHFGFSEDRLEELEGNAE
jgi:predicted Zn-dependent protease with MMP-like domain